MANKKITQLATTSNVGAGDFFPVAVAGGGTPVTKKAESPTLATYILNPVPSSIPSIGFTGTQNVYFDKSNWIDTTAAAGDGGTHAYIMVNKTDGQLTTGSGIANPVGGDNMGNCVATQNVNMQNNSIINIASLYFNATASTVLDEDGQNLVMQAARDMTVSGIRHVHISGQALSLASTPISGNVNISRGLNFQGGDVSITNNSTGTLTVDNIVLNKTSKHDVYSVGASANEIDWSDSNIQKSSDSSTVNYYFTNAKEGQTVTMYIDNSHASQSIIPTFASGTANQSPNSVLWGGTGGPPPIDAHRTNVYTFVCIGSGIFASAITGYEYT